MTTNRNSNAMAANSRGLNTETLSTIVKMSTRSVNCAGALNTPIDGELVPYVGNGQAPPSSMWAASTNADLHLITQFAGAGACLRMVWGHELRADHSALGNKRIPVILGPAIVKLSLYACKTGDAIKPGDLVWACTNHTAVKTGDVDERWVCDIIQSSDAVGNTGWVLGVVLKGTDAPVVNTVGSATPITIQLYDAPRYTGLTV